MGIGSPDGFDGGTVLRQRDVQQAMSLCVALIKPGVPKSSGDAVAGSSIV